MKSRLEMVLIILNLPIDLKHLTKFVHIGQGTLFTEYVIYIRTHLYVHRLGCM